jgi:hypothetical protein
MGNVNFGLQVLFYSIETFIGKSKRRKRIYIEMDTTVNQ